MRTVKDCESEIKKIIKSDDLSEKSGIDKVRSLLEEISALWAREIQLHAWIKNPLFVLAIKKEDALRL